MSDLRTAAQQALEALEYAQQDRECPSTTRQAIAALRAALAQNTELDDMLVAMEHAVAQAAAVERKACADICDAHASCEGIAQRCAADIRARGQA